MISLTIRFASSLPGRLSTAPRTTTHRVGPDQLRNWTNCSGQTMQRIMPSVSSRSNMAYAAGAARLGILGVGELDGEQHAAEHDLGAVLQGGGLHRGVGAVGGQRASCSASGWLDR